MITKNAITMTPAQPRISDHRIKEIVSSIVERDVSEWNSLKIKDNAVEEIKDYDSFNRKIWYNRQKPFFGMVLYINACKKYNVHPSDVLGKPLDAKQIYLLTNRAHKLTYCEYFREYFYKPFMYKIIELTKFI